MSQDIGTPYTIEVPDTLETPRTGATVKYYRRRSYGRIEDIAIGEHADAIKTLTRRKTLTPEDMDALRSLGCAIKKVEDPTL
jgi:hypothetical protein